MNKNMIFFSGFHNICHLFPFCKGGNLQFLLFEISIYFCVSFSICNLVFFQRGPNLGELADLSN